VTESGGSLSLHAQTSGGTVTVGSSLVGDLTSHGNFVSWPKTYLINGINFSGDALPANRELVFALNDAEVPDPANATDTLQLRLGANNNIKLGWKLNGTGSNYNWLFDVTPSEATSITGVRLTIDAWRYSMVVTTVGGALSYSFKGNFPLAPLSPAWNPAQWNSVGGANNGKSSLLFRAERKPGAGNTFAQSAISALTVFEPGFSSDFEASTIETEGWSVDGVPAANTYDGLPGVSLVTSPSPVRSGTKAVMCRVHQQDPNISEGKRAELARTHVGNQGLDRWYAFSVYLQDWAPSQYGEIIAQWIADPDKDEVQAKGPYLALGVEKDVWFLESRWDNNFLSTQAQMHKTGLWQTPTTVEKNQWVDFVLHIRWSSQSGGDGLIQLWKNGSPVTLNAAAVGPNAYNDLNDIAMKLGIYRYSWNTNVPASDANILQRILYLDSVRTADKYLELNDLKMH
jgi:hypothetical protein